MIGMQVGVVLAIALLAATAAVGVAFVLVGRRSDREHVREVRAQAHLEIHRRPWADTDRQVVPVQAVHIEGSVMYRAPR